MDRKYYFLAGLHRSGNTVLSSILNQNPDIYSSPIGPVCEYIWQLHKTKISYQSSLINTNEHRSLNMIAKLMDIYYYDVTKPIVIERDKNWAHPANIEILKTYFDFKPKIIFTTRPILEILASYISVDPEGTIALMISNGYQINEEISMIDNVCEYLLNPNEEIYKTMAAFDSIDNPTNADIIYVVKYEDLLSSPTDTMNKIYDFLEIDRYTHNFNNIKRIEQYNDTQVGLSRNMHKVRPVLGKSRVIVEEILSPYIIEKYKDLRYF